MTTSTTDTFSGVTTEYMAAVSDLEAAIKQAAAERLCAANDRIALKDVEAKYKTNPPELPEGVRDNAETRAAALSLALRKDEDYQALTDSLSEHEQAAAEAEAAAEIARFRLRLWLRVLDHHNALLGMERGA